MKQIIYFIIITVTLLIAFSNKGYSQDDRWVHIGEKSGTEIYIDAKSIYHNVSSNSYKVYVKTINSIGLIQIHLWIIYCSDRTLKLVESVIYNRDGTIFDTISDNEIYNIIPESNQEKVFLYLCK